MCVVYAQAVQTNRHRFVTRSKPAVQSSTGFRCTKIEDVTGNELGSSSAGEQSLDRWNCRSLSVASRSSPTQLSRQSESDRPEMPEELPAKRTDVSRSVNTPDAFLQSSV